MSPVTHLLASWIIAAKTTRNSRDTRLVALSGILPDLDGLGLLMDLGARAFGLETFFYERYHHFLLHGLAGGIVIAAALSRFAQERMRVGLLCLGVFHLHLLCDLIGSRGPSPEDIWPIFYFGPVTKTSFWRWEGQWQLDAWPNQVLTIWLFAWSIALAVKRGDSFVGVLSKYADEIFVRFLRECHNRIVPKSSANRPSQKEINC